MIRILRVLFDGKKPVNVSSAVNTGIVEPQRIELANQLKEIDNSYKRMTVEAKKMKRQIDTALAIALSTGGLK